MPVANRVYGYTLSVVMVALVLWPACREEDSFPLSNFPMFSYARPDALFSLTTAQGVKPDGSRTPLPPEVTCGNVEVLLAMVTISNGVENDPDGYCAEVARRVAESDDDEHAGMTHVELVTSDFDAVAYFERAPEPLRRVVHVRCEVPR